MLVLRHISDRGGYRCLMFGKEIDQEPQVGSSSDTPACALFLAQGGELLINELT